MVSIKPTNLQSAIKQASVDGRIDRKEFRSFSTAIIRDLAQSPNAKDSLHQATKNLLQYLDKFGAEGLMPTRPGTDKEIHNLAEGLYELANNLEKTAKDTFGAAMGISLQDGKITIIESKELGKLAEKLVKDSADPEATALQLREVVQGFRKHLVQANLTQKAEGKDGLIGKEATRQLGRINAFLGQTIARTVQPTAGQGVSEESDFAIGIKQALGDGWYAGDNMEAVGALVDAELGRFNTEGLFGQAKLRLDKMADGRGAELLAYVDTLGLSDGHDLKEDLYRMVTGKFCPPEYMGEFQEYLTNAPLEEINEGLQQFGGDHREKMLGSLGSGVAGRNWQKANDEVLGMLEARKTEMEAEIGIASLDTPERRAAVLDFLNNHENVKEALADGATLGKEVRIYNWPEALAAIKNDYGDDTHLEVVLQNMIQENVSFSEMPENYAFATIAMKDPENDVTWPFTIVMKREGDDFVPAEIAKNSIPLTAEQE